MVYCLSCKIKDVNITNGVETTKKNRLYIIGQCSNCNKNICKQIKKNKQEKNNDDVVEKIN
jgi:hypothetical protein